MPYYNVHNKEGVIPYLVMDGNANEAISFYQEALNAEVIFKQTFGEMPENPDFIIADDVSSVYYMLL